MASSTASTTINLPPPPKASPKAQANSAEKSYSLRTSGRENGSSRNRRRSIAHLALLDTQAIRSPHGTINHPTPLSSILLPETDTLPTLSPAAQTQFEAYSPDKPYFPGQAKSLAGIALRAFCLGIALAVGAIGTITILLVTSSPLWRLPFFLAALATFHFLEFWTTAAYNTREADVSSFLLTANWPAYAIAHTAAAVECLLTNALFPGRSWAPFHTGTLLMLLGVFLVVVGQVVRSAAMVQAGPSFNHIVQQTQKREHILVTTGIYGTLRHPSYFGFFWWGLGTQLAMGNVVCFIAYAAVLWRFFSTRIMHEELFLVKFFGEEYVDYRKKTGTKIPFVP
ncbi:Protein-S-isoprenylcysteine O-methyltransferase [Cytospora mali]|uniref:Protein-S-isoprenylcysteine O-methyltransferase n=1 Tax=Cytospora mali TaxID=578113 RepID=A0A194VDT8_CYTMA|nr:Protein-S-isoprenylcysteine O-methyltransferase [Valsa mali var. pyri (nom. inval.)]